MRLKNASMGSHQSGPNLTSLVDVVMVVLIFLMLAGSIDTVRVLQGKFAGRANASPRNVSPTQAISLDIRVLEDPTGSYVAVGPGMRVAGNVDQLLTALSAKQRAYAAAGINSSDVQVVIRPARDATYQHVLTVYETAQRARFTKVAFAASN
jgi:biopolymer transport protein ExbD